jgi:hypothetical protein
MTEFRKIRFTGGLGDCLLAITAQRSLYATYKNGGLFIHYVYSHSGIVEMIYNKHGGDKIKNGQYLDVRDYEKEVDYNTGDVRTIHGSYPTHQALYDLLSHWPNIFYLTDQRGFSNLEVPELNNHHCCNYPTYQDDKQLKDQYPNAKPGLPINFNDPYIDSLFNNVEYTFCIQLTGGNPLKKYDDDKWVILFKMILEKYPSSRIFLIDQPNYIVNPSLLFDYRIISLVGKISILQCAKIIQTVDYLIAPCSYSKYLRKWVDGKQIILVMKLPDSDPDPLGMIEGAFNYPGLLDDPNVTLLGVKYTMNDMSNVESILEIKDSIKDIDPMEIFNAINLPKSV